MLIQAYADDSGVHDGQSTHLVLAAFIAGSDYWARFSEEWASCLRQPPAIRRFKMKEAAGCSGEFYGLSKAERDAKLIALARIINRCGPLQAVSGIDLRAHAQHKEAMGGFDAYFWPFQTLIWDVTKFLWKKGTREKFEFIFDEQLIFGPRARDWYRAVGNASELFDQEAIAILPTEPQFRRDEDALPLQAADMYAWCARYAACNPHTPHPFEWLLREFGNVRRINSIGSFTPEAIAETLAKSAAMNQRAWTPEEISAHARFQRDSKGLRTSKAKKKK